MYSTQILLDQNIEVNQYYPKKAMYRVKSEQIGEFLSNLERREIVNLCERIIKDIKEHKANKGPLNADGRLIETYIMQCVAWDLISEEVGVQAWYFNEAAVRLQSTSYKGSDLLKILTEIVKMYTRRNEIVEPKTRFHTTEYLADKPFQEANISGFLASSSHIQ